MADKEQIPKDAFEDNSPKRSTNPNTYFSNYKKWVNDTANSILDWFAEDHIFNDLRSLTFPFVKALIYVLTIMVALSALSALVNMFI